VFDLLKSAHWVWKPLL